MIYSRENIIFFWKPGDYKTGFLSQWFFSDFIVDDIKFNCCEQFMMYNKAMLFKDDIIAKKILETKKPDEIKRLGRDVKNFSEDIWNQNKNRIVYLGNYAKFIQNKNLKNKLLNTGNKFLAEASPYDAIWGIGLSEDNPNVLHTSYWGQNLLGKTLMNVREIIRLESKGE